MKKPIAAADFLQALADASVLIESDGQGSGAVIAHIGRNSYVLTCQHVIGSATKVTAVYRQGKRFVRVTGKVERVDADSDLAIVRLSRRVPLPAVPISDVEPTLYERTWIVGSPCGRFGTVWEGLLSASDGSNMDPKKHYQISSFTAPGSSGGLVANFNGELVGVVIGIEHNGHETISGIVFAVPLPVVRQFLIDGKLYAQKKDEGK